MSDVIFDSERVAKREEKKKGLKRLLIPLGILVLLIIIVVVVALIVKANKVVPIRGGENTPYPYSWYIQKDGSISFSIDHSAFEGHSWRFKESDNSSVLSIEKDEKQKSKSATSFTLKPLETGRALQTFELYPDANDSAVICELMLFTEVTEQEEGFKTEFLGASVKQAAAQETGGDNDFSYTITSENSRIILKVLYDPSLGGSLQVLPGDETTEYDLDWTCTPDGDMISVESITTYRGRVTVRLAPGEMPVTGTVVLRNDSLGAEIYLTCSVWENGEIKAENHGLKRFEP